MIKQAIVILSGGPDSTAAAVWAMAIGYDVSLVTFQFRDDQQYGELFSAMQVAAALKRPHKIIDFKSPIDAFAPNMHVMMHAGVKQFDEDKSKPYLMPYGSGTLLSFAAAYSVHEGVPTVIWGSTADDANAHWEYSQEFCDSLSGLIRRASGRDIELLVPFAKMHKPEVMATYVNQPSLFGLTWSCRTGHDVQCGICEGCLARRVSASLAGIPDSSNYVTNEFKAPFPDLVGRPFSQYSSTDWERIQAIIPLDCKGPGY